MLCTAVAVYQRSFLVGSNLLRSFGRLQVGLTQEGYRSIAEPLGLPFDLKHIHRFLSSRVQGWIFKQCAASFLIGCRRTQTALSPSNKVHTSHLVSVLCVESMVACGSPFSTGQKSCSMSMSAKVHTARCDVLGLSRCRGCETWLCALSKSIILGDSDRNFRKTVAKLQSVQRLVVLILAVGFGVRV